MPDAEGATSLFRAEAGVDQKYDDLAIYVVTQTFTATTTVTDGDWITEPYLTLSYTSPTRLPTKLIFDFTADIYARYSIQDYETFRFVIRQAIDDKTAVAVKYTFIPYIFFGDDLQAAPGTGSSVPTREQSHQIHVVQVTADREVMSDLTLSLSGKYGVRNAESTFSYRDFTLWGGSIEGTYRLMPETKLLLGSSYERDAARGGKNAFTGEPDDATYDQVSAYAGLTYSISNRWLLKGRYAYRWRDYTTSLVPSPTPPPQTGDTLHYGRRDSTNSLLFVTTYKLAAAFYANAGYESIWRDSTKSYADYHENIYTVGLNYRF